MSKTQKEVDLFGLGWTDQDFLNPYRRTYFTAPVGQRVITPKERAAARAEEAASVKLPVDIPDPLAIMSQQEMRQAGTSNGIAGALPMSAVLTPNEQLDAQAYVQDPNKFVQERIEQQKDVSFVEQDKAILSRIFDYEDEVKETALESVWDGFLGGLFWAYDRKNQYLSYGIGKAIRTGAALAGGNPVTGESVGPIPEISFEEAADISPGQLLTTLYMQAGRRVNEAFGLQGPVTPWGSESYGLAAQPGFDIKDPAQREAAFTEDTQGRLVSGTLDAVFTVFTDPLLYAGWGLRLARLRYVDKPITTRAQIADFAVAITDDVGRINVGQAPKTPQGEFVKWVTEVDEAGRKARSVLEIAEHPVIRWSSNRDQLTWLFKASQTPDDAALVLRAAYGDIDAKVLLLEKKTSLAFALGEAEKANLVTRIAYNPGSLNKQIKKQDTVLRRKQEAVDAAEIELQTGRISSQQFDDIVRQRDRALDLRKALDDVDMRSVQKNPATAQEVALTKKEFDELVQQDEWLRKAMQDDIFGAFKQSYKTFSKEGAIGLAIEKSRQSRAVTAAQTKAIAQAPWTKDTYYNVGGLKRTVNIWRWAWAEKPSGQITTRGVAANEQGREILANLNTVPIYTGRGAERIVDGKRVIIGGQRAKEELYETYVRAVGGSLEDQNKMALVIDGLERKIINDIGAYYRLPKHEIDEALRIAGAERAKVIRDIKERKFFVERIPTADGGVEIVTHRVPFLDSHLQQGTYLLNFQAFAKIAKARAKELEKGATPLTKGQMLSLADDTIGTAAAAGRSALSQNMLNFYNAYNNFWRPVTLLRLGYTQRNAAEGLFRAAAYTDSLLPLGGATVQAGNAIKNLVVKRAVERDLKKLSVEAGATAIPTRKFKNWRQKQEEAIEMNIAEQRTAIEQRKNLLATELKGVDTATTRTMQDDLAFLQAQLDESVAFRDAFIADDFMALAYYRSQGAAKRRMYDGTSYVDGVALKGAFADPDYAPIAVGNLSADPSIKMNLSLRDRVTQNFFKAVQEREYVEVFPNQKEYWAGVARMLMQYRASDVGAKVLAGESPEQIARWLMTNPRGKEIAEFVTGNVSAFGVASGKKVGKGQIKERKITKGGFDTADYDGALGYVNTVVARLEQLAPNPQLRQLLARTNVSADDVKALLDTPVYRESLKPAVGNIAVETGSKKITDAWRGIVTGAFKWAGTMPEDTFVRTPFYGARYATLRNELIENMKDYYTALAKQQGLKFDSAMIPIREINRAHNIAHRRALKDTKDWLYTIERRTNLGHYGEYIFPFITSAQNTTTAIGRLVWKNPALPEYVRLIWQAPDQAGITDDQGNIVLGVPLNFIPKGLRDALSIDAMQNIKIPKGGLNVWFPETGFGIVPRFGPNVGVPIGGFMQYGFFGLGKGLVPSGFTPDWLTNILGKERGNAVWDFWRDYIYGEDRMPSTVPLMADQFLPAQLNRLLTLTFGMNARSYASTHEKIRNAELIRIMGNEREMGDIEEFNDEIENKTRWHFALRWLGNMLGFTPPQYEFIGEPLVQARRMYDRTFTEDADKAFYEQFGGFATLFTLGSLTKNVAGLDPADEAIRLTTVHSDLARQVASNVNDLTALGAIFNDPENEYDPTAVSWQTVTQIPGTSENYRKLLDPREMENERARKFGWIKYLQLVEGQEAIMQQRGLTSLRQKGAEQLLQQRRDFVEAAKNNPLYNPWYRDYTEGGSARTDSVVRAFRIALSNEKFMKQMAGNTTFEAAYVYLQFREQIIEAVKQSPYRSLRAKGNKELAATWDSFRATLANRYPKWGIIQARYLNGDEDPTDLGYQWWQYGDTSQEPTPPATMYTNQDEEENYDGNPF